MAERGDKLNNVLDKGQELNKRAEDFLNMARALNGKKPIKK